ncbi:uncharacterized protein KGF55_001620 [Candida pseudojiufengensis]|uniref:uncharacterized protein n=1 Tax=Candida pseudojiufengensis TaxID=497109 RepID=UPI00222520DA|nr:uncharacterized protein KGF55_001620 [Candida pseudojiufengensis]KAI5965399.1 hypothetical protein KGF55_001620 [Candida pseudojiufengensis]
MILNLVSIIILLSSILTSANPVAKRAPKHLSFPLEKVEINETSNDLNKRSSDVPLLNSYNWAYFANIAVGSNKTPLKVQIDTGSYSLWVPENTTQDSLNQFNPFKSKTFKNETKVYGAAYGGGASARGYFGNDDLWLPDGTKVPNYEFGVVNQYSRSIPFWGIGQGSKAENYTITLAMKNAGLINHAGLSLDLSTDVNKKGNLLFGAIDKAKYEGDLTILPLLPGGYIAGKSFTFSNGKVIDLKGDFLLDSGAAFIYMLKEWADPILTELGGGKLDPDYNFDCSLRNENKNLTINLNGVDINIPYYDLFYQYGSTCKSTIAIGSKSMLGNSGLFGDTFLRYAYAAFSYENNKVGIAQAVHNDETDIIDFYF